MDHSSKPQQPQPGSEPAKEALESTSRPQPSEDAQQEQRVGQTPDGLEEDESLRDLKPRAIDRQFGSSPDIQPEANQREGVKEWLEGSPEMRDSFPDDAKSEPDR